MTELAHRTNHGVDVSLFWDSDGDRLFVVVEDRLGRERFCVIAPRARALDAFHHPFAYAAPQ